MNFIKVGDKMINAELVHYIKRAPFDRQTVLVVFSSTNNCEGGSFEQLEFKGEEADAVENYFGRQSHDALAEWQRVK